jgi:hypothetical protein
VTCAHCKAKATTLGLCPPCADAAGERGRRERIAQGLPPVATDAAAYARLSRILDTFEVAS